jgi:hypothetical protein
MEVVRHLITPFAIAGAEAFFDALGKFTETLNLPAGQVSGRQPSGATLNKFAEFVAAQKFVGVLSLVVRHDPTPLASFLPEQTIRLQADEDFAHRPSGYSK